jgi:hypothetical protein
MHANSTKSLAKPDLGQVCMCVLVCVHACVSACSRMFVFACLHTKTHTCLCVLVCECVCVCMYVRAPKWSTDGIT